MKIGFIGAGSMASALARGLGEPALVYDVDPARAEALAAEIGGTAASSNRELAEGSDLVILAHKPVHTEEAAEQVGGAAKAIASIVGTVPTTRLEAAYPGVPVYRFIPNIPVEVGRGVLCYAPGSLAAEGPEDEVLKLFGRAGVVIPLDEAQIDPAMAIMSCGPAFVALVVDSMAAAGARHGIERTQATRLVTETMAGTAAYLDANGLDPKELMGRVATPGGVTEKGLKVLEERGLPEAVQAAVNLVVEASR
jgi:pyrroline-5-carboxylate reductase